MKIMHITATHLNPIGGVPVVLKSLVSEQNKIENYQSIVISVKAPTNKINSKYFNFCTISDLENKILSYNPDCVIIHSFFHVEYAKVSKICRKHKIKYFIEPHGAFVKNALRKSFFKKIIANSTIFRPLIKQAYGFIYLNQEESDNSIYHTSNDLVISNGTDYKNDKILIKENEINMYYIGRYDIKQKGINRIFRALETLDKEDLKLKFYFYGNGSIKAKKYIENHLNKLNNIKVFECGPIFDRERDKKIEQLGISVLVSKSEGQPMSIIEGWAYGNPCIISKETNLAPDVINNKLGWVTETDVKSIAKTMKKAIQEYQNNTDTYKKRCKNYIDENFRWKDIALDSYNKLKNVLKI